MAMRIEEIRSGLVARLQARREEIEAAISTRIRSISDPSEGPDPEYTEGQRAAVAAALDYGIAGIERSGDHLPPIPTVLLFQARIAARRGVKLETILRRYLAGYTLLGDFLIEEAERDAGASGSSLRRLLRAQARLFDRLLGSIGEEYSREHQGQGASTEQRRAERVQGLLAGELLDTTDFAYEFEAWHLGMVLCGPGAQEAIQGLAGALDCRPLLVARGEGVLWAWLGNARGFDPHEVDQALSQAKSPKRTLALGEPARGLPGWRLTHRQAKAAMSIALRDSRAYARYADVSLLASMLQDDLLATSLREIYIAPLEAERDGGELACQTLRAYFESGRNVSSAAATLKVTRQTVGARLRAIEERLGRTLDACASELDMALRLQESGRTFSDLSV